MSDATHQHAAMTRSTSKDNDATKQKLDYNTVPANQTFVANTVQANRNAEDDPVKTNQESVDTYICGNRAVSSKADNKSHPAHEPLDGGWGWVITFSAFIINAIVDGIIYSFGIFFKDIYEYFDSSKSLTSWIVSVLTGVILSSGPVTSMLISKLGTRKVAMFGSILSASGFFLSTLSPNVQVMILLYSVLGGAGLGCMFLSAIVTVGHYFTTKRALAVGIASGGSGAGAILFAPLSEFLINTFSWKGSMWIISGICLNGVVMGALFRPIKTSVTKPPLKQQAINTEHSHGQKDDSERIRCCNVSSGTDFFLLRRKPLVIYVFCCSLCMLGYLSPTTFLPDHAEKSGLTSEQSVVLITVISGSIVMSRIATGWIADRPWSDTIVLKGLILVVGGLATIFVPFYSSFALLVSYSIVVGMAMGMLFSLLPIISVELVGLENMTSAIGLINMCMGVAALIGTPIGGFATFSKGALTDLSGSYNAAFRFTGATFCLSGLLCFLLRRILTWDKDRKCYFDEDNTINNDMDKDMIKTISFNNNHNDISNNIGL